MKLLRITPTVPRRLPVHVGGYWLPRSPGGRMLAGVYVRIGGRMWVLESERRLRLADLLIRAERDRERMRRVSSLNHPRRTG
jgi:hypothetical protein